MYSTQGKKFTVNTSKISGKEIITYWLNPRNGEVKENGKFTKQNSQEFTPPTSGYGHDWILVVDDIAKNYPSPAIRKITMKIGTITILALLIGLNCFSQIRVSDNQKFLVDKNGKPFFWVGDTDWELFHRMTREQATEFINTRSEQGFNVLQAVALAEFNGIREPNRYGDYPLNNEDPTQLAVTPGSDPNNSYQYDYWDHVDFIINLAAEKGMYIGLAPDMG